MYILKTAYQLANKSENRCTDALGSACYQRFNLEFELDETTDFINRSDLKIMRQDGIAAVLAVEKLLEKFPDMDRNTISLFVSSGAFIEDSDLHYKKMQRICSAFRPGQEQSEMLKEMYRSAAPLLALETLTNSSMSFISKYNGLRGYNSTLGNTSMSAVYALISINASAENSYAVAVGTNSGGDYSYLSGIDQVKDQNNWEEGSGAACVLLAKNTDHDYESLAVIQKIQCSEKIPALTEMNTNDTWMSLLENSRADAIVHSGAYTLHQHQKDEEQLHRLGIPVFSHFGTYGNMGSASVMYNIAEACKLIKDGCGTVEILNRDIFGREGLVRIQKA